MGIKVTDDKVDAYLANLKKQYYGGSEQRYQKALKQQGLTEEQAKVATHGQLISEALFKKVTSERSTSRSKRSRRTTRRTSRSTGNRRRATCATSS